MLRKRIWLFCATLIVAIIVSTSAVAFSAFREPSSPRLGQMSNSGERVAVSTLPASQINDLRRSNIKASEIRLVGERAETQFFTALGDDGQPCFLTSRLRAPRPEFSVVACLGSGSADVPSASTPLVDFSAWMKPAGDPTLRATWLTGFAADHVAEVRLEHNGQVVHRTPVVQNVYATPKLDIPATALVAADESGNVVHRRSMVIGEAP
jgi:hypothetical protein